MPPEGGASGHIPPETGQCAWHHYRAALISPWDRVPTVCCSTHWAWGFCVVWEARLPHKTSSALPQRRNGRAFSSLTARGGGLPFGVINSLARDRASHQIRSHPARHICRRRETSSQNVLPQLPAGETESKILHTVPDQS